MRVLVLGSGVSGRSANDYLNSLGIESEFAREEFLKEDIVFDEEILDRLIDGLSFIVISPGISEDICLVKHAKEKGVKVIGELELGTRKILSEIIAVTGTNGKTTTTSLIYFLLKDYNRKSFVGGNIGVPVSSFSARTKQGDIVVLECSSFQLETIENFKPKIAIILNVTEDHLNRHKTMENYISCKMNITKNQDENDYLLINADSEILMENLPKTRAKILYFSTRKKVCGCYIRNGCIYFNDNNCEEKLASLKNIKLVGEHNLSNILASCLAVYLVTKNKEVLKSISQFEGVSHRLEYVKTIHGVKFYNDSKATNIDSTLVAVSSFKEDINLILGGSDKGYEFDKLFANLPKNVKNIAIFGQTKQKIAKSAKKFKFKNYYICDTLKDCVKICFTLSKPSDVILLSPACASFDHFSSYEERGNVFKKIVGEIAGYEDSFFEDKTQT